MWSRSTGSNNNLTTPSVTSLPSFVSSTSSSVSSASATPSATGTAGDDELPPGWTKKESKSQKGRYYYISPSGKTQWVRPSLSGRGGEKEKPGASPSVPPTPQVPARTYSWHVEVEIEFGEGRLGVSLREVKPPSSSVYPEFQAEVDDLPKVNGKAGPAELYNWSVKPDKRLTIGMRVTSIGGLSLAGLTYLEVVDRLKRAPRPLRMRFADVAQGTVEDNPNGAASKAQEAADKKANEAPSAYMMQKQEYTRLLVMNELHSEMWSIENKKLTRQMQRMLFKWDMLSKGTEALTEQRTQLRKEHDQLLNDKKKYEDMIRQLRLQESNADESPEVVRANELSKRNSELNDDIARIGAGNKKLRKERATLQSALDELESALSKLDVADGENKDKNAAEDDFFGIDRSLSSVEQLAECRKKISDMEEELSKEQRKAAKVEREMEQLNRHLASLQSSSNNIGGKREDALVESNKSMEMQALEARIVELRKKQRATVQTLSKAAQAGDQGLAIDCQKRRQAIKEELARTLDELNELKRQEGVERLSTSASPRQDRRERDERRERRERGARAERGERRERNDRSLPHAPSKDATVSPPPVLKTTVSSSGRREIPTLSGFLAKGPTEWSSGGIVGSMKSMRGARERWCEFGNDGKLRYFKRRGDPIVRGEIDIADPSLEVICEDTQRGNEFIVCTSTQQSRFFTKNTQELSMWVKTLRTANAILQRNKQAESTSVAGSPSSGGSGSGSGSMSSGGPITAGHRRGHHMSRQVSMPPHMHQQQRVKSDDHMRATLGFV